MNHPILTSSHNPLLRRVRRWVERPRLCRDDGVLIADGIHLVEEALTAGFHCLDLLIDAGRGGEATGGGELSALVERASARSVPVHTVTPQLFRQISPVETPQGILGVFARPAPGPRPAPDADAATTSHPWLVACGIQDPSNLGSMVRSARATGVRHLWLTRGTVDPYHHRALRASMGATFHLSVHPELDPAELVSMLRGSGRRTLALSARGETHLAALRPDVPSVIVIGSEGQGLPPEIEAELDHRVAIPMEPGIESLSVPAAAAVVLYWLYLGSRTSAP